MRLAALFAIATAFGGISAAAGAQPAHASDAEARRAALYHEGSQLAEQGKWNEAADRFRAVIAIRSAPKARIALAVAQENLGHLRDAEQTYLGALAEARAAGSSDDESTALVALRVLALRIPRIGLDLPAGAANVRVRVDGAPRAIEAGEVAVDPGEHTLLVDADGRASFRSTVRVAERDRVRLPVQLPPTNDVAPSSATTSAPSTPDVRPPIGGFVVGGLGVAAVGVGAVLWAVGKGKESDIASACPDQQCPESRRAELAPEIQSAHDTVLAGNVVFAVGLVGVAVGAAWEAIAFASRPKHAQSPPVAGGLSIRPFGARVAF